MDSLPTAVLKALYFAKEQSIADISDTLDKSIPLITKTIRELLADKLIVANGHRNSTGGRKAMSYSLNKDNHGILVAVAIDQYLCSITTYDIHNNQLDDIYTEEIDLNNALDSYKKIENLLNKVILKNQEKQIMAIGITMPGFVDFKEKINNSFLPDSPFYNLRERIVQVTGLPTYIENDSSAIAIVEQSFGMAKNIENSLVVNFSWGIGLGMIINNKLFRGNSGFAGEFSHIPLATSNKLCSCGKNGCLEVEASLRCAIDFINVELQNGEESMLQQCYKSERRVTFDMLLKAYRHGDQLAIKAVKKIAYMLGKGISTLIHILNPERIIISGRGAAFGQELLHDIQSANQEFCIPRLSEKTEIQISTLQNTQLLSCASIAIQQMNWDYKSKHI